MLNNNGFHSDPAEIIQAVTKTLRMESDVNQHYRLEQKQNKIRIHKFVTSHCNLKFKIKYILWLVNPIPIGLFLSNINFFGGEVIPPYVFASRVDIGKCNTCP